MRLLALFLGLLLFAFSSEKAGPRLKLLLSKGGLEAQSEAPLRVFVKAKEIPPSYAPFVKLKRGELYLLEIPLPELRKLLEEETVLYASLPAKLYPSLDKVAYYTNLVYLWNDPENAKWDGSGVIIGIADTGIDYTHPAFRGRILEIYDLTTGEFCSAADVENDRCPQTDYSGHGTHVAGIAAGNGELYKGVATGAQLIVFKLGNSYFTADKVVQALEIFSRRLKELGKKGVMNLSLGGVIGPHDGTDLFTALLDQYAKEFPLVVAAGNFGAEGNHFKKTFGAGETLLLSFTPYPYAELIVDLWYPGSAVLSFQLSTPCGETKVYEEGDDAGKLDMGDCGEVSLVPPEKPNPENGDKNFYLHVLGNKTSEVWTLTLQVKEGSGTLHAWADGASFEEPDPYYTISNEAAGKNLIAVGSFTSKVVDSVNPDSVVGKLSFFSSLGPTRPCSAGCTERTKPDLVAPGEVVCSTVPPVASDYFYPVCAEAGYAGAMGTSMSAPAVAGAVARLLHKNPTLTPSQVKDLLLSTAYGDRFTGTLPNNLYGYGKLDVYELVASVEAVVPSGGGGGGCNGAPSLHAYLALLIALKILLSPLTKRRKR